MKIQMVTKGDFENTKSWLDKIYKHIPSITLMRLGQEGVANLESMTPVDTGVTANSWRYSIDRRRLGAELTFTNSHAPGSSAPLVILKHYGHGTRTGGYVPPNDFINPALAKIMDEGPDEIAKEVFE